MLLGHTALELNSPGLHWKRYFEMTVLQMQNIIFVYIKEQHYDIKFHLKYFLKSSTSPNLHGTKGKTDHLGDHFGKRQSPLNFSRTR